MADFEIKPLTPEEERDLRIFYGDAAQGPHHESCECTQECRDALDARDVLRILAMVDDARRALFRCQTVLRMRIVGDDLLSDTIAMIDAALEGREVGVGMDSERTKEVTHGRTPGESSAPPRDNGGSVDAPVEVTNERNEKHVHCVSPASGNGGRAPIGLTSPQVEELTKQRDKGPQPTYGSARARVQNNLVALGLSRFIGLDACAITADGLSAIGSRGSP